MTLGSAAKSVFSIIWTAFDGLRKVLHLLLLLFIFGVVFGALSSSTPLLPRESALLIKPMGSLVEEYEGDPYERAIAELLGEAEPQTLVIDVVDGLRFARDDERIKGVVLDLSGLGGSGLSKLQRVGEALDDFRESGKPVVATADFYGQEAYFLAAHADEIYLHPEGAVFLQGFGRYRNYFKSAIDKLKIDWNIFRVGTHKSAVEPFMRDDMSDEDEESSRRLIDQLWHNYQDDVLAARSLAPRLLDDMLE
ncbi:MAG: S49 family peptidase, partial [Woeseiaceae bacterium]